MRIRETKVAGCYELIMDKRQDERGWFVKTFRSDWFADNKLETRYVEQYYSHSYKDVIRGLHFQIPPMDHIKVVYCLAGTVTDAVVDLRVGSPTYGRFMRIELSAEQGNMLYIPAGLAHGFCVRSETATLVYNVSSLYSPDHDRGIRWDSAGIPWPAADPIISDRDLRFPRLDEYHSPFRYSGVTVDDGGVQKHE